VAEGDKAVLAYVVSNEVAYSWHRSVLGLFAYDAKGPQRLQEPGGFLMMKYGTGGLIAGPQPGRPRVPRPTSRTHEWLFWLDTDMGFTAGRAGTAARRRPTRKNARSSARCASASAN
jgi:hypothetical protein